MNKIEIKRIAAFLKIEINENGYINGYATLDEADSEKISYANFSAKKKDILNSKAKLILCHSAHSIEGKRFIKDANPDMLFTKVIQEFFVAPKRYEISSKAIIHENAIIGKNCNIGAGAIIEENVTIGENTFIGPNTVIHSNTRIGNNTMIQANCTIGNQGFGFYKFENHYYHFPHTGKCIIGDFVYIGCNSNVNTGTIGNTIIHSYVKIDDMVHIAHNAEIGENTLISGQSGIAGSTKIGKNCLISGKVAIFDHLNIGDNSLIAGGSVVLKDVPPKSVFSGYPARPQKEMYKSIALLNRIPKILNQLKKIIR